MTSTPANERSRASTISTNTTSQPQPPANLSKQDATDWLAIDRALAHIDSVIPSYPYVLQVPQDVEPRFHHRECQAKYKWLENTPFRRGEHEASQYLTWHFHDPGDIYAQQSTEPHTERSEANSRVGTPRVGSAGPKKTMSFGAYRKKVAGGTPVPEEKKGEVNGVKKEGVEERKMEGEKSVKKPAVKGSVERVKADEEVLAAVEDGEDIVPPVAEKKKDEGKRDLKRKREDDKEEPKDVKRKREDSKMSDDREKAADDKAEHKKRAENQSEAAKQPERAAPSATKREAEPSDLQTDEPATIRVKTSQDAPATEKAPETKPIENAPRKAKPPKSPDKTVSSPSKSSQEKSDVALPPRLSPLREEHKQSDPEDLSMLLPPRLSPTLPANITASLEARKTEKSTPKPSTTAESLTPRKSLENGVAKRKSPMNGFRANSSSPMVRSDVEETKRAKTSAPSVRSPSPSGDESEIPVGKNAARRQTSPPSKLVVKLKFKQRSTRESVKQLLKLPAAKKKPEPKPSPTTLKATDARHREQRDTTAKGVAQKVGPATKGVARKVEKAANATPTPSEKRPREDESESDSRAKKRKKAELAVYEAPAKRKKAAPESPDLKKSTPATPAPPVQQPPTPASSVKQSASQPTPSAAGARKSSKDLLAAATTSASVKREASHESQGQVATPSAASSSPAASSTSQPAGSTVPRSTPTNTSTPTPAALPKTQRQKDWEAQRQTFDTLGRELKRAAQADLNTLSENKNHPIEESSRLRHHIAAKIIESLLAYFLSFVSDDESLLAAEPRQPLRSKHWRTLEKYLPFVKRNLEAFPELQGLVCGLAVVFCARIMEICVEEKGVGREVLGEAWALLAHSAGDAEAKLDVQKMREAFPKAWKESERGGEEKDGPPLEPGKFAGGFKLPLGVQTKPIRAVRAAHAMLSEWIEREGVGYEMRVKLE